MKTLLAILFLLASTSNALAQSSAPPPGLGSGPINKITTSDGMTSYHDTHGNRVNTYTSSDGITTYHSSDGRHGTIHEQSATKPLEVPESYSLQRPSRPSLEPCHGISALLPSCR